MRRDVRRRLDELKRNVASPVRRLLATGGSATALAVLAGASEGTSITSRSLRDVAKAVRALDPAQRAELPGLSPDRGRVVLAGLAILVEVMDAVGAEAVEVTSRGVRHGVALELASGTPGGLIDAARSLAIRCGVNALRGHHEAAIAGVLAAELASHVERAGEIASAAAWLRGAGLVASSRRTARLSRGIVRGSELWSRWPIDAGLIARIVGPASTDADAIVERLRACLGLARRLASFADAEDVRVGSAGDHRPAVFVARVTRAGEPELERCGRWALSRLGMRVEWERPPSDRVARHAGRSGAIRAPQRPLPSGR